VPRALAPQWYAHPQHGPLPVLLLLLTLNTGVVDAVSILSLGRVFIANMTGNVVFVGFAAAGAPGFSLSASLWALAGFVAGAYLGGHLIRRISDHRGRLFQRIAAVLAMLIGAILGALLVIHVGRTSGLAVAVALVAVTAISASVTAHGHKAWHSPRPAS